jgi:hypothetical protein
MSYYDRTRLYELLPAVYRVRDAELGFPLRELVGIIAAEAQSAEEDIARLYDNWFIETCDHWVVPYIGDLIGVRQVHVDERSRHSRRAEVANTISYRRRKGTAAVLEQLARDVTGWPARVVEFFELLNTSQYTVNHIRPHSLQAPDLRLLEKLELLDGPFESAAHTLEVRRIPPRLGRYNVPNVGVYVWRVAAYPLIGTDAREVADGTGLHFTFSPLGNDVPLFNQPQTETGATHIAEEINVPDPIRRRAAHARTASYYGPGASLLVSRDGVEIALADIVICNLEGWLHAPDPGRVAIDPALGRLAFPAGEAPAETVRVAWSYGFADDTGGGPYERAASLSDIAGQTTLDVGEAEDFATVGDALAEWNLRGRPAAVIAIHDSHTYVETIAATIPADSRLEIRAVNEQRPTLLLAAEMSIDGGTGSAFELNGLLIANHPLRIGGEVDGLRLTHVTFVPGRALDAGGAPQQPGQPSLILESPALEATISRCLLGPVFSDENAEVTLADSVLDANARDVPAYADLAGTDYGAPVVLERCTVIGSVLTRTLRLGDSSLFLGTVTAERRQEGCLRYSFVPVASRVPRRFECQPEVPEDADAAAALRAQRRVEPRFSSLRYGDPRYCRLHWRSRDEILRGAADESAMGVFSGLQEPQREDALRTRLEEYLPVGLEAGILYAPLRLESGTS